jgi:hypothetical protein
MATELRVELWRVSLEIVRFLKAKLMALPTWDKKTLYLASQLNTIHVIAQNLEQKKGKVLIGSTLQVRVLLECVSNAITGCNKPGYAYREIRKIRKPRMKRGMKSKAQKKAYYQHVPRTWQYKKEAESLWKRGNCTIHGDADTSFYLRADPLNAVDVKTLALALVSLVDGTQAYLNKIGAFYTSQAQSDAHFVRFKDAVNKVHGEPVPEYKAMTPFEDRVFTELNKHGAKLKYANKEADTLRATTGGTGPAITAVP